MNGFVVLVFSIPSQLGFLSMVPGAPVFQCVSPRSYVWLKPVLRMSLRLECFVIPEAVQTLPSEAVSNHWRDG
jgi:hypothetical protein